MRNNASFYVPIDGSNEKRMLYKLLKFNELKGSVTSYCSGEFYLCNKAIFLPWISEEISWNVRKTC